MRRTAALFSIGYIYRGVCVTRRNIKYEERYVFAREGCEKKCIILA